MKRLIATAAAALALIVSVPAQAAVFVCDVRPASYLGMGGDGAVVTWVAGVGILSVCNVRIDMAEVSAQGCLAWYSTLLTWRAQNKTGRFYFNSANSSLEGKTACSQFSEWNFRAPYFLEGA